MRDIAGSFEGCWGDVGSVGGQMSDDYPDEGEAGDQVTLEDGKWVSLRWDQVV